MSQILHNGTCFVCSSPGTGRIDATFTWDAPAAVLRCEALLGSACQGPPGFAHGGALFALLDEAMGGACWMSGLRVLSAHVGIDYRRPVPLGSTVILAAQVVKIDGRKVYTTATLHVDGVLATEADGLFVASERHNWDVLPH